MISNKGTGIRGRPRSSRRLKTRDCGFISVSQINKGSLCSFVPVAETLREKGRMPCLDDLPRGSRQVEGTIQWPGRQPRTVWLELTATRPHFGGLRQWFQCPLCGRRAGKLYLQDPKSGLACRRCLRLVYSSQYRPKNPILAHLKKVRRAAILLSHVLKASRRMSELCENSGNGNSPPPKTDDQHLSISAGGSAPLRGKNPTEEKE